MGNTSEGGKRAAETTKGRRGKNFYRDIGALGGKVSRGGGWTGRPDLASEAGKKGGAKSRRGKSSSDPAERKSEQIPQSGQDLVDAWESKVFY